VLRALLALSLCASVAHADGYRLRGRTPVVPDVTPRAKATICIDRDFIRRVIRKHMAAFARCYERLPEGGSQPSGSVTTRFVILADGRVSQPEASGLTPEVDACVARTLASIRFPRISGGGTVLVSYPFTFSTR
jgi:hypothetical protein